MQIWRLVVLAVATAALSFSNIACLAWYANEYDLIYASLLNTRYVKRLNIVGKAVVLIITFPFTIFTLGFYVMSNIVYWAWLIVRLIFSKSRNAVIEEHREHMKDTCWYSRLTML